MLSSSPAITTRGTFCVERPTTVCHAGEPLLHSSRVKHGCQLFLPEENLGEEISGSRGIILHLLSQRFHAPVAVSGRAGETFSAGSAGRSRSISARKWGREHSDGPPAVHSWALPSDRVTLTGIQRDYSRPRETDEAGSARSQVDGRRAAWLRPHGWDWLTEQVPANSFLKKEKFVMKLNLLSWTHRQRLDRMKVEEARRREKRCCYDNMSNVLQRLKNNDNAVMRWHIMIRFVVSSNSLETIYVFFYIMRYLVTIMA